MATLHQATLTPTKTELAADWLPRQPWFDAPVEDLAVVGAFRIDDPDGEVGVETMLVTTGGDPAPWQVAWTYRAAPLDGADDALVGTMEHSALGRRYVYDAPADPVYQAVVRATVEGRGGEADLERVLTDGTVEVAAKTMTASGTGGTGADVVLERRPPAATDADESDGAATLLGRRADRPDDAPLVLARLT